MRTDYARLARLAASLGVGTRWIWHELTHDRGQTAHWRTGSPLRVLLSSSFLALSVIVAAALYGYFGKAGWLFQKEGPLEQFTFLAELVAAALMAAGARCAWVRRTDGASALAAIAYAVLAVLLFVVGMEEISWGQQLFHFATPYGWAERNYQHETSLHNLLDREAVDALGQYVTYSFLAGVITLTALSAARRNAFILAVAPHPSLIPLACAIALASVKIHGEVAEAFVALYFLFYSYRVYRMSTGGQRPR